MARLLGCENLKLLEVHVCSSSAKAGNCQVRMQRNCLVVCIGTCAVVRLSENVGVAAVSSHLLSERGSYCVSVPPVFTPFRPE
jgi:hypothetical protein